MYLIDKLEFVNEDYLYNRRLLVLYLKALSLSDGQDIYNMLQEIEQNDNGFHNKVYGMTFSQFKIWLANEFAVDNGKLEAWMVPQSSFWMYDDTVPVGYGRIRHYLNDSLKENSGHIGYAVAYSKRGQGYGNSILALLKEKCVELGIKQVQVGANTSNERSNKVIIKNGGSLLRESNGKSFYLIDLVK